MASDYLSKSKGVLHLHSRSHAMPGDRFPGDTSIAGDDCARMTSAKFLRKPEGPWCVVHTFATAVLLQSPSASLSGDRMVPWMGKALHCFPL